MKKISCVLLIILLVSFSACKKAEPSTEELLSSITNEMPSLSYGTIYLSTADEGTRHYMSSALFSVLYGDGSEAPRSLIEEFAIYLSSFQLPCEVAVFKCYSPSDTERIEKMCLMRLSSLKKHFKATPHESVAEQATIIKKGSFVIMALSKDLPDLERIISKLAS